MRHRKECRPVTIQRPRTETYAISFPGEEAATTYDIARWLNSLIGKEIPVKPGWRFVSIIDVDIKGVHEGQSFFVLAIMEIARIPQSRQSKGA